MTFLSPAAPASLQPILARLDAILASAPTQRLLLLIDGPCGSGKSTLASQLTDFLNTAAPNTATLLHMDDFCIPHAQKTPERLAIPGGNVDSGRLCEEVLTPFFAQQPIAYRRYDCHADAFSPLICPADTPLLILEGSYSLLPDIRRHAALSVFLTVSPACQQQRLLQRVGPERLKSFNQRWIPLENAYFKAYHLPDDDCLVLSSHCMM